MDIGSTIRQIRQRKKITITQLCEGTGLSKGFISNVENNKTSPSICTLESIAHYLNVPLSYLLLTKEQRMKIVLKNERQITTFGKDQLKIEQLISKGGLKTMVVEMPPGSSTGDDPHVHEGIECHTVLKGKVLVQQGEDQAVLQEGDSFSWHSSVPHSVKNIGDDVAKVFIAVYSEGILDL